MTKMSKEQPSQHDPDNVFDPENLMRLRKSELVDLCVFSKESYDTLSELNDRVMAGCLNLMKGMTSADKLLSRYEVALFVGAFPFGWGVTDILIWLFG